MLPGFRFLLAAIVLSTSTLIFGLGAAALLRAAHEQFASTPYWHPAADATFTQQAEAARVVLALLRAEPAADEKASDQVIAASAPALPQPRWRVQRSPGNRCRRNRGRPQDPNL